MVERPLSMRDVPGSIPGTIYLLILLSFCLPIATIVPISHFVLQLRFCIFFFLPFSDGFVFSLSFLFFGKMRLKEIQVDWCTVFAKIIPLLLFFSQGSDYLNDLS